MRVIIAGSRDLNKEFLVRDAIQASGFDITTLVCGMARGVDMVGHAWARSRGIPIDERYAQWKTLGRSAGYKRNVEMAENADALIAVWDGSSRGTSHMIEIAAKYELATYIYVPRKQKMVVKARALDGSTLFEFSNVDYYDPTETKLLADGFSDMVSALCGGTLEMHMEEVE